jgi:arabinogalactan oligomer/maltooligosaccharide transport system permease protein
VISAFLVAHVVVWHAYRAEEERALARCAALYNAAHPDVSVEPVAVPYDAYSYKLEAAIPRGNGPDLFVGKHDNIGEWSRAGLLQPMDEVAGVASTFLTGTVDPLRVGGHLWGAPLTFKSLALFYRTDKLPRAPATTDELERDAARVGLAYEAGNFFYHAAWLHGFGGAILDGARPALDSDAAVRSLAFVRSLADRHLLPEESSSTVATQLFNDGRAAITINGPWFLGEIAPGVPFAVAPLPTVSATGRPAAPLVNMEAAMLAARAREPQAAIAFALWLAGPEASRVRALEGRQTPAARAAWDDPKIANDPILSAFRAQLAATVPMSNAPEMRAVWEPAQKALRRVLRGAADPKAALDEAEREVVEALRPAPPPAAPLPWALALAGAMIALAAWSVRRARSDERRDRWAWAYLFPAAAAMAVLVFVPFSVGAGMSFFHYEPAGAARWIFVGARNFLDILQSREFYATLGVTALWTVANVSLHVAIGVTLALLLRDPLLRLRGVYRVLLIVPWAVPNYITALIWKGMFHRQFGAVNGLLAMLGVEPVSWFSRFSTAFCANVATNVWLGFPFFIVVTLGALSRIPKELEEAAALDGASAWQRLTQVILPLLRPALLPSVLLGCVWTFNMFNIVFLVSGGEPDGATEILVSQAYRWAFTRGHRYGYAAAYAVLIFAVLAIQSALSRRVTEVDV